MSTSSYNNALDVLLTDSTAADIGPTDSTNPISTASKSENTSFVKFDDVVSAIAPVSASAAEKGVLHPLWRKSLRFQVRRMY